MCLVFFLPNFRLLAYRCPSSSFALAPRTRILLYLSPNHLTRKPCPPPKNCSAHHQQDYTNFDPKISCIISRHIVIIFFFFQFSVTSSSNLGRMFILSVFFGCSLSLVRDGIIRDFGDPSVDTPPPHLTSHTLLFDAS